MCRGAVQVGRGAMPSSPRVELSLGAGEAQAGCLARSAMMGDAAMRIRGRLADRRHSNAKIFASLRSLRRQSHGRPRLRRDKAIFCFIYRKYALGSGGGPVTTALEEATKQVSPRCSHDAPGSAARVTEAP